MARPTKTGVDYFPLDVNMDTKFELIEAKHGIIGFGILIKLFQKIYSEGYYIEWSEEMSLLFSKRNNVDINSINAIIMDAIKYNIFNKQLFDQEKILTSKGIQRRFIDIIKRRKTDISKLKHIIVDINSINADNNSINDSYKYTKKSKVKESKEKEKQSIKQQQQQREAKIDKNSDEAIKIYFENNCPKNSDYIYEAKRFININELKKWEAAGGRENWQQVADIFIQQIDKHSKNGKSTANNTSKGRVRDFEGDYKQSISNTDRIIEQLAGSR
jgi:hypothetical protein